MLSLVRHTAHVDFAAESQRHLDALRAVAAGGASIDGTHFENRQLWKNPKHKRKLVGEPGDHSKCVWCERRLEWKRELNVEHYRPKAAVTRWEGTPPLVSNEPPKEVEVSGGYWWLAFHWDNYSLACDPCNQGWKRNLFPVREPRPAYAEGVEMHEEPLLLNPMSPFRTGDHFSWTPLGIMNPKSDRGAATIITCGLNREHLVSRRGQVAKNVIAEIERFRRALRAHMQETAKLHCLALKELCAPESEFAGMNRWWVERTLGWTWEDLVRNAA